MPQSARGRAAISVLGCLAWLAAGLAAGAASRTAADPIGHLLRTAADEPSDRAAPAAVPVALAGPELATLRETIALAVRGDVAAATARRAGLRDPVARSLAEWTILRADDPAAGFARHWAFARAHPVWPEIDRVHRRAELRLWTETASPDTVLRYFAGREPLGAAGRLALGRALLARGDRAGAARHIRAAWRADALSAALEQRLLETAGALIGRADHLARFRARLFADDLDGAMRAARRLGAGHAAIVTAHKAARRPGAVARKAIEAVPAALHREPAYQFTRAQWLRRAGHPADAAAAMLAVAHDPVVVDPDAWWKEARILVRELLDGRRYRLARRVAAQAPRPVREGLRVDQPFTAGWIALRYLGDARTAERHFAAIRTLTTHPTSLARAGYWLGRAAEASGRRAEARRHYEAAAQHSAAYYGQLARARIGLRSIAVRRPPPVTGAQRAALKRSALVRAVDLLYATGHRDLVVPFVADLDRVDDVGVLTLVAEATAARGDARAMTALGRGALARGLPFDHVAFPDVGLPAAPPLGPRPDPSLVYAIARAESAFDARVISSAKAVGLMQVTAPTGRVVARRLGVAFDAARLHRDPAYNVQLGAAEITDLVTTYDGNHVLAFVGYNAGRGRVRQWTARYGDPRDPAVDPVDWVERIPFTETRIYVQRVMENLQIYRSRFRAPGRLTIDADMRGRQG
ncbi:lytic transglycosylase domain-containing protein [Rhodoplanes sp. TEM]|uniref:Lytic transglycosylase domain-containing protein n=1 Tax=Rhodoplanes tepidamans TaxID=200616 RepID=A0ABT5J6S7_RHOTP|nr:MULTISPECIES: lytic transglycosylase domain-containing protein [Rhodoplanes]MDC7785152.1 lytic transglycosylase domain-containing protein [Rhodoplanes tepidamans]MDC7982626.1 lytic transglycosylase domain-containing protein [Rhodoplanes sp. TEM]MDQ0356643.1 soluble lytic murein transglycosylase [Rhodoplanes tepidamans]